MKTRPIYISLTRIQTWILVFWLECKPADVGHFDPSVNGDIIKLWVNVYLSIIYMWFFKNLCLYQCAYSAFEWRHKGCYVGKLTHLNNSLNQWLSQGMCWKVHHLTHFLKSAVWCLNPECIIFGRKPGQYDFSNPSRFWSHDQRSKILACGAISFCRFTPFPLSEVAGFLLVNPQTMFPSILTHLILMFSVTMHTLTTAMDLTDYPTCVKKYTVILISGESEACSFLLNWCVTNRSKFMHLLLLSSSHEFKT